VALLGCGGTIPFVTTVAKTLPQWGVAVGLGLGDPHSNARGANESVALDDLHKSCSTIVHIFHSLSTLAKPPTVNE